PAHQSHCVIKVLERIAVLARGIRRASERFESINLGLLLGSHRDGVLQCPKADRNAEDLTGVLSDSVRTTRDQDCGQENESLRRSADSHSICLLLTRRPYEPYLLSSLLDEVLSTLFVG